jgi:ribonuclease E
MQTQLTAAVKKAPGNPFVRVKPGVFGLLRYPEISPEERAADKVPARPEAKPDDSRPARAPERKDDRKDDRKRDRIEKPAAAESALDERGRRRRRRGGRGRGGAKEVESTVSGSAGAAASEQTDVGAEDGAEEPSAGGLSPEARAAALAETGVLEGNDDMMSADDDADDIGDVGDRGDLESAGPNIGRKPRHAEDAPASPVGARGDDAGSDGDAAEDDDADDEGDEEAGGAFAGAESPAGEKPLEGEAGRRRRRRRRTDLAGAYGSLQAGRLLTAVLPAPLQLRL